MWNPPLVLGGQASNPSSHQDLEPVYPPCEYTAGNPPMWDVPIILLSSHVGYNIIWPASATTVSSDEPFHSNAFFGHPPFSWKSMHSNFVQINHMSYSVGYRHTRLASHQYHIILFIQSSYATYFNMNKTTLSLKVKNHIQIMTF